MRRTTVADICFAAGLGALLYSAWMIRPELFGMVAGAGLIGISIVIYKTGRQDDR